VLPFVLRKAAVHPGARAAAAALAPRVICNACEMLSVQALERDGPPSLEQHRTQVRGFLSVHQLSATTRNPQAQTPCGARDRLRMVATDWSSRPGNQQRSAIKEEQQRSCRKRQARHGK
jgi:hypothetical protein